MIIKTFSPVSGQTCFFISFRTEESPDSTVMHSNVSFAVLLTLATLGLADVYVYPAFLLGMLTYLLIIFCNLLVFITIVWSKKLHKPMFILLLNLPISDMLGATALFPQLIVSIVTKNRVISYPACATQGFLAHIYGTGNLLTLSVMAYDRYVAICYPLRYNQIMTSKTLVKIIIMIWAINISFLTIMFLFLVQSRICRTNILDLFCNYPSLMKLICGDTRLNNYYALFYTAMYRGGALAIISFTYVQILRTCLMTNRPEARQKAIQTCGSHLTVYLIFEMNAAIIFISHRIDGVSLLLQRVLGMTILIFPPILDPIIYGLKTKELKQSIKMFLHQR